MVTIVIADDHRMVQQGFKLLLEKESDLSVIGVASDGREAIELVAELHPDILIVDLNMPGLSGIEVIREIYRGSTKTKCIVLSMFANEEYVVRSVRNGAAGYVLKDSGVDELVEAVRTVYNGRRFLSQSLSARVLDRLDSPVASDPRSPYESLTVREREVLYLLAEGLGSRSIADRLFISSRTVDKHRANIMEKLNIHNERELVRYAIEQGVSFISPPIPENKPRRQGSDY